MVPRRAAAAVMQTSSWDLYAFWPRMLGCAGRLSLACPRPIHSTLANFRSGGTAATQLTSSSRSAEITRASIRNRLAILLLVALLLLPFFSALLRCAMSEAPAGHSNRHLHVASRPRSGSCEEAASTMMGSCWRASSCLLSFVPSLNKACSSSSEQAAASGVDGFAVIRFEAGAVEETAAGASLAATTCGWTFLLCTMADCGRRGLLGAVTDCEVPFVTDLRQLTASPARSGNAELLPAVTPEEGYAAKKRPKDAKGLLAKVQKPASHLAASNSAGTSPASHGAGPKSATVSSAPFIQRAA
mmetsp:Transcript_19678/g.45902  ORF Transcript_19678/g.45902 Transcript_19678/m.45902 type:complete len:301 (+) Transcript_19678:211-1113(+)